MPMISNRIPTIMMVNKIRKHATRPLPLINSSETSEMMLETTMVTKKIVTTQRIVLFRSLFAAAGSCFDTKIYPF